MKLFLLTLLFLPTISMAQQWHISGEAGGIINTKPSAVDYPSAKSGRSPIVGISLFKSSKRFEAGLTANAFSLYIHETSDYTLDGINKYATIEQRTYIARRAYAFTPFFNYRLVDNKNILYAGVKAGIIITTEKPNDNDISNNGTFWNVNNPPPSRMDFAYHSGTAFTTGVQVGYRRIISKIVSVGAEANGNYFSANLKPAGYLEASKNLSLFYYGAKIAIGITIPSTKK